MTSRILRLVVSLTLAALSVAQAAQTDAVVTSFLARARVATEKYKDQRVAIADGYRAMGPEAPAMGQHWVQPSLLVAARVDVDHPPILEYVTVRGRPVLAGVGYALPLGAGEFPPDSPAARSAWHSHEGGLEEEGGRFEHEHIEADHERERVEVLHAWIWVENPAGPFAPVNWALPFVRAGLEPGVALSASAKALSLDDGGVEFWAAGLRRALDPDARSAEAVHRVLEHYADTVAAWRAHFDGTRVRSSDAAWLAAVWERVRGAVIATLNQPARERASMLSGF